MSLKGTPQKSETWLFGFRQMDYRITISEVLSGRPYLLLLLNVEQHTIQAVQIAPQAPSAGESRDFISEAILHPAPGASTPAHRPSLVVFEDAGLMKAIEPWLSENGIAAALQEKAGVIDEISAQISDHLSDEPPDIMPLINVPGVTPELVGSLFSAAAEYFRAEPWLALENHQPVAVRIEPEEDYFFVIVMGFGGMEYGLLIYDRWEDLLKSFTPGDEPLDRLPPDGWHSLSFESSDMLPEADLEAIQQYGWVVAGPQAYPFPLVYHSDRVERPGHRELLRYEAILRALPIFTRKHLKAGSPGEYLPVEADISVQLHSGPALVSIRYPAGEIPLDELVAVEDMLPYLFDEDLEEDTYDFRYEDPDFIDSVLEEIRARMTSGRPAPVGEQPEEDEALEEAQELMYAAWDEDDPDERIALAEEALEISPNCTDAYLLLADERAETVEEAAELFRRGMQAGERVLGPDYFQLYTGQFWQLAETRPYMRAREGLANLLWAMEEHEAAEEHYRALLELNPIDNQGIRYSLVNLLLEINRARIALDVIERYRNDPSAFWLYSKALALFQTSGPGGSADQALKAALKANRHVPAYLTGRRRIPQDPPEFIEMGARSEAVHYAFGNLNLWRQTPGAVDWLKSRGKIGKKNITGKT